MTEIYHKSVGEGPPLVLISGFTADHQSWTLFQERLAKEFTLYFIDNPGSGRSYIPSNGCTIESMAEDILKTLDPYELDKFHLLGHSMGSAISQVIAAKHPERVDKLVLMSTFFKRTKVGEHAFRFLGQLHEEGHPKEKIARALLPWIFSNRFLENDHDVEAIVSFYVQASHQQSVEGFWCQYDALQKYNGLPYLPQIEAETLILHGDEDIITPLRFIETVRSKLKHSSQVIFEKAAHVPHLEDPELFYSSLIKFLK